MGCSNVGGRNNCRCRCECKCECERVDPCAEERRRCYCKGFRDGCNCAPCCERKEERCDGKWDC
jgi:hypothetical protein